MKDLQFGTLYKFFVSFGTLLMSAPVVLVGFIINAVATGTVLKDLNTYWKNWLINLCFISIFISFICFFAGIILLIIGIKSWKKVQKNQDRILENQVFISDLERNKLTSEQLQEKTKKELNKHSNKNNLPELIQKALISEKLCADYFTKKLGTRYSSVQNTRLGSFEYDMIALDNFGKQDILFEFKCCNSMSKGAFYLTLERCQKALNHYNETRKSNSRFILVLVSEEIDNTFMQTEYFKNCKKDYPNIEVQIFNQSQLI